MADNLQKYLGELKKIGEGEDQTLDIAKTALLLAALEFPDNQINNYINELNTMASDLKKEVGQCITLIEHAKAITNLVYKKYGFAGDINTYNNIENANLMRVIDRRKGLPVALGILVMHLGRSQGWKISGLNFPGHFLLRMTAFGEHIVLDPFDSCRILLPDDLQRILELTHGPKTSLQSEFIRMVSDKDVLIRLQNNIKIRALSEGNKEQALKTLLSMTLVAPKNVEFLAELALMEASEGNYKLAIDRLNNFIKSQKDSQDVVDIENLLVNLKRRLN
jgi:regulator of sirC expression with transglutaminase-like and TPR domain